MLGISYRNSTIVKYTYPNQHPILRKKVFASKTVIENEIEKIHQEMDCMFDLLKPSPCVVTNIDMECHIDSKTNVLICK